jgi:hypothetical protein
VEAWLFRPPQPKIGSQFDFCSSPIARARSSNERSYTFAQTNSLTSFFACDETSDHALAPLLTRGLSIAQDFGLGSREGREGEVLWSRLYEEGQKDGNCGKAKD